MLGYIFSGVLVGPEKFKGGGAYRLKRVFSSSEFNWTYFLMLAILAFLYGVLFGARHFWRG